MAFVYMWPFLTKINQTSRPAGFKGSPDTRTCLPVRQGRQPEDYLKVQRILDAGGTLDEDGRVWQASIIATDDEDGNRRTYLGTLERL